MSELYCGGDGFIITIISKFLCDFLVNILGRKGALWAETEKEKNTHATRGNAAVPDPFSRKLCRGRWKRALEEK
ncbi:hypothetical protein GWI33_004782 [Rhynchophorus ferrugineus]|uniref:Uncharacterized protein n=1 Tax=Rhynchophorus ferrugineus TaxID=354439 RepID=A0A834MII1_RHYFE|nr:hypothetical protein GWI33_004782 [Rhynchophorus ferrugineus]